MTKRCESFIDPKYTYSTNYWVVSFLAKQRGENPEHAFIVVEGMQETEDGKCAIFRRYDFGSAKRDVPYLAKAQGAVSKLQDRYELELYGIGERKVGFWLMLNDLAQAKGCHGISWVIDSEQAEMLDQAVKKDILNPPDYQISGTSQSIGENCCTWSIRKLKGLGDQKIDNDTRLKFTFKDAIIAATTNHLVPPPELQEKMLAKPFELSCFEILTSKEGVIDGAGDSLLVEQTSKLGFRR